MNRRHFLQTTAFGSSLWFAPGAFADMLTATPKTTEGPFYPDKLPLDTDNDLLILNNSITPAVGEITYLTGRVLSPSGEPLRNAFVEIWQCDHQGAYLHSGTDNDSSRDKNFQGYGRFLTDSKGQYCFRTIKPVPYPGRTPHIHFGVSRHGQRVLTTQLFVKGHPQNERDGILKAIRDQKALDNIMGDFQPLPGSRIGELAVNFDIVLGMTPNDPDDDGAKGIGKSERESGMGMGRGPRGPRGPGENGPPPSSPRPEIPPGN
ncbi:dioxygenase family protein [Planctomicrobium piriforme]|uniref:Protocatechuate 3,4-dioxygenase beta subunit n=1 Tax=Planctomicrobium piriforme TaxID=1576369 RepID=A0A1I3BF75_9PLAN|nr:protocatechuate 3,4-dioxygenase [Planctomicrobium piriforme]SFH60599.1 protocatechuate 3,4-dioxygenase beta subunit [Planctomicrobium piriforme]